MAIQNILKYLQDNKGRFSQDVLLGELRKSGYPEIEIQEALKMLSGADVSQPPSPPSPPPQAKNAAPSISPHGKKIGAFILGFFSACAVMIFAVIAYFIIALIFSLLGYRFLGSSGIFGLEYGGSYYIFPALFILLSIGVLALIFFLTRYRFPYYARGLLAGSITFVAIAVIGGIIIWFTVNRSLNQSRVYSRDARRIADIKQLQLALELFYDAKNSYPEGLNELSPTYIPSVPKDPAKQEIYHFERRGNGSYYLKAELENSDNSALRIDLNPGNTFYEVSEKPMAPYTPPAYQPKTFFP